MTTEAKKKRATIWPKGPTRWTEDSVLYVSVPFTWNLWAVAADLRQRSFLWDRAVVGGPAARLMPEALAGIPNVTIGTDMPGVLQRVNPDATRTTVGCPNRCGFCAVPTIEGQFRELNDWPDRPVLCDNNLLAASDAHCDRVFERLAAHGWCDFNQGLDARRLTARHAKRLAEIPGAMVRLALDNMGQRKQWQRAYDRLREACFPKSRIRSYALVGFKDTPTEAWERCVFIDEEVKVLPMWFHELDATRPNVVTERQQQLGWNDRERRRIMRYFYKHSGTPLDMSTSIPYT